MIIYSEEFEWYYAVHHFVSVIAFYACSVSYYIKLIFILLITWFDFFNIKTHGVFPYIALFRLLSEASTIFINFRWIILTLKMKSSSLYIGNTIAAVVVFFLIRIVTIVPNWWIFFASIYTPAWDQVGLIHKFICVGSTIPLDILNV